MTVTSKVTWRFARTDRGIRYGFNNASMEHFKHDPIVTLIRETIQNSLDAHQPDTSHVEIDIRECKIAPEIIGAESLRRHLQASFAQTRERKQVAGQKSYRSALRLLDEPTLSCLSIIDRNTTGLQNDKWDSLIYEEGTPAKDTNGAHGGSFGIGKNASYNVAALHTVIYSTRYPDGMKHIEKMTGRAQLVSHYCPDSGEMLQNIGFLEDKDDEPLAGTEIPADFRLETTGTGIWIVGFMPKRGPWYRNAIRATIDNFFHAIHTRRLVVNIHPRERTEVFRIDHESLNDLLITQRAAPKSQYYYHAVSNEPIGRTKPVGSFGVFAVYLNRAPDAPKRVAYVNRRGMLITDTKERRRSNPFHPGRGHGSWPDYAAVVIAMDDKTDQQVRRMENPAHNEISLGRLPEEEQKEFGRALDDVNGQIREIIEQVIRDLDEADTTNLTELAAIFPDMDLSQEGNRVLDTRVINYHPRNPITTLDDNSDQLDDDSSEEDEANVGDIPGGGQGGGKNPRKPRKIRPKPKPRRKTIHETFIIRKQQGELAIALTPNPKAGNCCRFTVHPRGEEALREGKISIIEVGEVKPVGVKITHEGDTITVENEIGNQDPITFTLHVQPSDTYVGYTIKEQRQLPLASESPKSDGGNE